MIDYCRVLDLRLGAISLDSTLDARKSKCPAHYQDCQRLCAEPRDYAMDLDMNQGSDPDTQPCLKGETLQSREQSVITCD